MIDQPPWWIDAACYKDVARTSKNGKTLDQYLIEISLAYSGCMARFEYHIRIDVPYCQSWERIIDPLCYMREEGQR